MMYTEVALLKEESVPGRKGTQPPALDVPATELPKDLLREELKLPELDELSVVRHFTRLSQRNYSIDGQFYPLGSCTMKYNPKMNEEAAALPGFRCLHPLTPPSHAQGAIGLLYGLQETLQKITGFPAVSLQGAAGAQGELIGVLMIRAYHRARGDKDRSRMLIPDSAHGTNPASCAMAGFIAETIPSDESGGIDMEALRTACKDTKTLAGMMITNPSTLGLFERNIQEINRIIHGAGGLVYGDGANMNALTGIVRPADLGFDVMHLNLHKTFSTPHGGGGPGVGAVGAGKTLKTFLPGPRAIKEAQTYSLKNPEQSIGRLKAFNGNYAVLVRAYAYIKRLGSVGLRRTAEYAVLNANYLRVLIEDLYPVAFGKGRWNLHEFVVSPDLGNDIHTLDIAKRLIDYGFHPPTIYFPLIVKEAFMVEPTETESPETLEAFAEALRKIAEEAKNDPDLIKTAPHNTPISRLDETSAARKPVLCWC